MVTTTNIQSVNIRPEVSILSILKSVNYKSWYAIAEFVDNAIQSALTSQDVLLSSEQDYGLKVRIEIDATPGQEKITIRDNAGGISLADFPRAFRPASLPLDRTGLSEFGMGMKSAACWFADHWTVRTTVLGEPIERVITFNVQRIVDEQIEDVPIRERPVPAGTHFTEITLTRLNQLPQKKTITKIKSHLSSMYRVFLRAGFLELTYNGQPITYEDPEILVAPYHKTEDADPIQWKKDLDIEITPGKRITGFAAILDKGSTATAGFALLRRNRVILGSDDEGYRPQEIFGAPNSFIYQRLFGELHLEGFEVSHTKDGVQWSEYEDQVLRILKKTLNESPIPLLDQAKEYRARPKAPPRQNNGNVPGASPFSRSPAPTRPFAASSRPGGSDSSPSSNGIFHSPQPTLFSTQPEGDRSNPPQAPFGAAPVKPANRIFKVTFRNENWKVRVELSDEEGIGEWLSFQARSEDSFELDIRVALSHPFTVSFCESNQACLEPLIQLAATMAVAEIGAQKVGIKKSSTFRNFVNEMLMDGLVEE